MIVFEGIIGSGKSTASSELCKDNKYIYYPEPVNDNPYLEDFYKDQRRWALEMQFYLLSRRFRMHEEAIQLEWNRKGESVFDRSIYGDRAFAYLLHKNGCIDSRGYDSYEKHFDCMARFLLVPNRVIYLDVTVDVALNRIKKRGRACEANIPYEYLSNLDEAYKKVVLPDLKNRGAIIEIIDWNEDRYKKVLLFTT